MCQYCENNVPLNKTKVKTGTYISEGGDGLFYLNNPNGVVRRINFCPVCGAKLTPFDNLDVD